LTRQDESLRIVPQELWEQVKRRQQEVSRRSSLQAHPGGVPHRYLFSGLLECGVCGSHYVMRGGQSYACSFHVNRGSAICGNALTVRRRLVEDRLLRVIRQELFSSDAVAYLTQRVNEGLRRAAEERNQPAATRRRDEAELREAMAQLLMFV
jgi:site-specific DNA recombinase